MRTPTTTIVLVMIICRDPEASLALLVLLHGLEEVLAAKVRPQHVGEDQFGVRHLPEQEIRDPVLPEVRMTKSGSGSSG